MQGRLLLLWSEVGYNFRYSWAIKLQSAHWETSACSSHSVRHVSKVWQWSKLKIGTLVCNSVTNSWCFWAEIRQTTCQRIFLPIPIFCLVSEFCTHHFETSPTSLTCLQSVSAPWQHRWRHQVISSRRVTVAEAEAGASSALQLDHGHFAPRRRSHGRLVHTLWVVLQTIHLLFHNRFTQSVLRHYAKRALTPHSK